MIVKMVKKYMGKEYKIKQEKWKAGEMVRLTFGRTEYAVKLGGSINAFVKRLARIKEANKKVKNLNYRGLL